MDHATPITNTRWTTPTVHEGVNPGRDELTFSVHRGRQIAEAALWAADAQSSQASADIMSDLMIDRTPEDENFRTYYDSRRRDRRAVLSNPAGRQHSARINAHMPARVKCAGMAHARECSRLTAAVLPQPARLPPRTAPSKRAEDGAPAARQGRRVAVAGMFSKGIRTRAMADPAAHEGWFGRRSERQNIRASTEQVIALMHKAGYVERGKGGGLSPSRASPEDYTLGEILRAEGNLIRQLLELHKQSPSLCPQMESCTTINIWRDLGRMTSSTLDSKTLADIARNEGNIIFPCRQPYR